MNPQRIHHPLLIAYWHDQEFLPTELVGRTRGFVCVTAGGGGGIEMIFVRFESGLANCDIKTLIHPNRTKPHRVETPIFVL